MIRCHATRSRVGAATIAIMVVCVATLGGLSSTAQASLSIEQQQAILAEAQAAYDQGVARLRTDPASAKSSFRIAASRFQQLADDGIINGHLRYNLGNACLQAGDLGRAILNYRIAQRLRPGDEDIQHNLEHARSLCRSRIEATGQRALTDALLGWHRRTRVSVRFGVFAAAYVMFWLVLAIGQFRPVPGRRWVAGVCAVIWLACGLSVASELVGDSGGRAGVVLADDVIVRKGNGEGFERQFEQPLHEGVEFEVLERRPGWINVELANGKAGWVRADQVGLVS